MLRNTRTLPQAPTRQRATHLAPAHTSFRSISSLAINRPEGLRLFGFWKGVIRERNAIARLIRKAYTFYIARLGNHVTTACTVAPACPCPGLP